jgi:hypothetical protein
LLRRPFPHPCSLPTGHRITQPPRNKQPFKCPHSCPPCVLSCDRDRRTRRKERMLQAPAAEAVDLDPRGDDTLVTAASRRPGVRSPLRPLCRASLPLRPLSDGFPRGRPTSRRSPSPAPSALSAGTGRGAPIRRLAFPHRPQRRDRRAPPAPRYRLLRRSAGALVAADGLGPARSPKSGSAWTGSASSWRASTSKRELLALRFGSGLSAREIAPIVGKSEAAVKKQLTRTIATLKEHYRDELS